MQVVPMPILQDLHGRQACQMHGNRWMVNTILNILTMQAGALAWWDRNIFPGMRGIQTTLSQAKHQGWFRNQTMPGTFIIRESLQIQTLLFRRDGKEELLEFLIPIK